MKFQRQYNQWRLLISYIKLLCALLNSTRGSDVQHLNWNCLHEMCLIYFRIIKQKVGFQLVSVALKGVGRICHLVNIDTMEDFMIILKKFLSADFSMPAFVKLNCVLCGLKTLSGPGNELQIDACDFVITCSNIVMLICLD